MDTKIFKTLAWTIILTFGSLVLSAMFVVCGGVMWMWKINVAVAHLMVWAKIFFTFFLIFGGVSIAITIIMVILNLIYKR